MSKYNFAMTIYIESFLLENIVINFCLLRLVKITSKSNSSTFKMLVASILGAVFSVIGAINLTSNLMLNLLKLLAGTTMIVVCFKSKLKQQIINFILLLAYTYALAGGIMALSSVSYVTSFGAIMVSKVSQFAVSTIIIILSYIFELVAKHMKHRLKTNSFIYNIILIDGKHKLRLNAYLDTGNMLNVDGQGVLILDRNELCKLKDINLIDFCLNSQSVATGTVCGNQNLKLFKIDCMRIKIGRQNKEFRNQYVATSLHSPFKDENYQALLSPLFI